MEENTHLPVNNSNVEKLPKMGFGKKERTLSIIFSLLFVLSGFIVYFYCMQHKAQTMEMYDKISNVILQNVDPKDNAVSELKKENPRHDVWKQQVSESIHIFFNNLRVVVFVLVGAVITVYFYPTIAIVSNGAMLGIVMAALKFMNPEESVWLSILTGIVPHGIFEIPAIILACVMGARLGNSGYRTLFKKEQEIPYITVLKQTGVFFLRVLLPLLIIAAIVEMFITPHIMN